MDTGNFSRGLAAPIETSQATLDLAFSIVKCFFP